MMRLGAIAEFVNGRAFKPSDWSEIGLPIIRIQNLNDPKKPFNFFKGPYSDKILICNGDVLLSWSGTPGTSFGCFKWEGANGLLNQHIFKVNLNETICNKDYFVYAVNKNLELIIRQAHGGVGLQHITKAKLEKIEIPLPPLPVQERIVAILDAADTLRQKDQALLKKYDEIKQSLFLDMFGDPFSGKTYLLKGSISIVGGYAFKSEDFVDTGIPLIKIGTINKGYFDTANFSFLPANFLEKYDKWKVKKGDLLMSLTGTVGKDDYGNVEIADDTFKYYLLNQRVAKISPISNSYLPEFLYALFSYKHTKARIIKINRGVRLANISNKDIENLSVIRPSMEDQQKFVFAMREVRKQKTYVEMNIKKSEELFQSLLQKAFNGELIKE